MSTKQHVPQSSEFAYSLLGLKFWRAKHRSKVGPASGSLKRTSQSLIWSVLRQRILPKAICLLLLSSLLTVSVPAAPETIAAMASKSWQEIRFSFLSSQLGINVPNWFATLFAGSRNRSQVQIISRIQIYPGPLNLERGQESVFSAIAFDSDNEPLSGVDFQWSSIHTASGRRVGGFLNSIFTATRVGTFTIRATAGGQEAAVEVIVRPRTGIPPRGTLVRATSSRTGLGAVLGTTDGNALKDETDTTEDTKSSDGDVQPANLLPGEGWDSGNWTSADDPGNQTGNPPGGPIDDGAGNGNFQLRAPVVSLPGRGIDLALNLNYNSRVWNKSGNQLSYDIDYDEPAPGWTLGFGKIMFMGTAGGCMMNDADGTRHGYAGQITSWSSGASFSGYTTDGSFIDYGCYFNYGNYGTGWAKLANGTSITYSSITATEAHLFPTMITDAQGNYVSITYRNASGNALIETITDTTGRVITFQYDSLNRLISARAPRMQSQDPIYGTDRVRTLVRIHYKPLTLNYSFGAGITPVVRPGTIYGIDAIYYPATNTGYWFNDTDSYSSYGMITKVVEQRGMSWATGAEEQGTVTAGTTTKLVDYNYPLTATNQTGRTNGLNLLDAPTYETASESWDGADEAGPAITSYSINNSDTHWDGYSNSPSRMITVTHPNGTISKQYSYRTPGAWMDGLVFADETITVDGSTQTIVAASNASWQQGEYGSPRPNWTSITDERTKKVKTEYTYTGGKFNQVIRSCDYDDSNVLLRCTASQYENDPAYIGQFSTGGQYQSGRHVFNLIKTSGIENPNGTKASWTEYEYDNYTAQPFTNAPGVIQHNYKNDPFTTQLQNGACLQWDPSLSEPSCSIEGQEVWVPTSGGYYATCECQDYDQISAYDPATEKRGNVTKVSHYTDAQNLTGAIVETRAYDITGNMVKASSACCEQTSIQYSIDTQFAYPASQTRGSADPNSPDRITTSTVYDTANGLLKQSTDANGRTSTIGFNPDTMRPVKSTSSTGAYLTWTYDDTEMTISEEAKDADGNLASMSKKYLNGIGLTRRVDEYGPGGTIDRVDKLYNKYAQEWKQSRPYRVGETPVYSELFYDLQGRVFDSKDPGGSETKAFYNEAQHPDSATLISGSLPPGKTIRVMDAWGRERWGRYDQQNRLAEVVEPNPDRTANPTGSIFTAGSLVTKYTYNTLGELTQTEQGEQQRRFEYDSLGRLTRQKLAEQTATLNEDGTYVGAGNGSSLWGDAFWYDNRSNLVQKKDARGVRTYLSYQKNGSDDPLNRIQARSYDLSGPLDPGLTIYAAPGVTYSYATTGDKDRISQIRTAGILTEDYGYDSEGRVNEYKQSVDYRANYPMTVNYLYDTLDRIKEITYPAQYGLTGSPRKIVANSYDTASRLTGMTFGGVQQAGDIVYNASGQTTSINIGAAGNNRVNEQYTFDQQTGLLTNQKAIRNGSELLNLSYDYNRNNSVGSLNGKTGYLTRIVDNLNSNKNREYEFDVLGRLAKAKGGPTGNLSQQNYTYDRFGNRTGVSATGVAADNTTMPADGIPTLAFEAVSNRITTSGFQYDSAGNQIKSLGENGEWLRFEYDAANRVQVVKKDSDGSYAQAFQYGSSNARLMDFDYGYGYLKIFAATGGTTFSEYTEFTGAVPTWTKSYTYFGDSQLSTITPNGSGGEYTEYDHPDRLGNRLKTSQATGTSYEQAHLPFGRPLDAESTLTTSNKRFTSYDRSVRTGLDYAMNRTYDSKQGRFTQVDPIGMGSVSIASPQTLNLFAYCANDPINHTDATGLFWGAFFHWIAMIFKIILIAIAVVIAIAVLFFAPPGLSTWAAAKLLIFAGSLIASALAPPKIGAIIGIAVGLVLGGPGIIVNFARTVKDLPLWQKLLVSSNFVGAVANSFAHQKNKTKIKRDINTVYARVFNDAINRLTGNCRTYILGPSDLSAEQLKKIGMKFVSNKSIGGAVAQSNVGAGLEGTIRVTPKFFHGIRNTFSGWSFSGSTSLKQQAVILHELRHLIGGIDHPRDASGQEIADGENSNVDFFNQISWHCF